MTTENNTYILEYIWLDANQNCRSKTKIHRKPTYGFTLEDAPLWNYDGSSTGQATTKNSEVTLKPVKIVPDPFPKSVNSYLVLCECFSADGIKPLDTNTRAKARAIFAMESETGTQTQHKDPMFGLEQEFFISRKTCNTLIPVSFPNNQTLPEPQADYYCGVGGTNVYGREFVEDIMEKALYAGLHLTGMNAEVAPAQWEFQVCSVGVEAADDLILLRYIANRVLESNQLFMDLNAKSLKGDWNGSGCHINYSTSLMREEGGFRYIEQAIKNLGKNHELHIKHYGADNHLRLTGKHETSSLSDFSFSVAGRHTSIRIPTETRNEKRGYLEDRRPSSSIDPYVCTALLHATSVGLKQDIFS